MTEGNVIVIVDTDLWAKRKMVATFIKYNVAIYCPVNVDVVNISSLLKIFLSSAYYRLFTPFFFQHPPSEHPTFTAHLSVLAVSDSSALSNGSKLVDWAVISCVHRLKRHRRLR